MCMRRTCQLEVRRREVFGMQVEVPLSPILCANPCGRGSGIGANDRVLVRVIFSESRGACAWWEERHVV
jgi:hypothetical protein